MDALSPFSLLDKMKPHLPGPVGAAADAAAHAAQGAAKHHGFADLVSALDANGDGKLTGADLIGKAMLAGEKVLGDLGTSLGLDKAEKAADADKRQANAPQASATPPAQMLLAAEAGARPSEAAARALASLPGVAEIRASYGALRLR